jgi:RNA polymerase sigma-70 factor (ECF subfamily)
VRRVALNLARSRWRRLRSEAKVRLLTSAEAVSESPVSNTDEFWAEVRRLPNRQAHAVVLHYVEDRSVAEIAEVLGVAEGTVKALLHQGRERLRRQLHAKGLIDDV